MFLNDLNLHKLLHLIRLCMGLSLMQQYYEQLYQMAKPLQILDVVDYSIQDEINELVYVVINANQAVYQLQFK